MFLVYTKGSCYSIQASWYSIIKVSWYSIQASWYSIIKASWYFYSSFLVFDASFLIGFADRDLLKAPVDCMFSLLISCTFVCKLCAHEVFLCCWTWCQNPSNIDPNAPKAQPKSAKIPSRSVPKGSLKEVASGTVLGRHHLMLFGRLLASLRWFLTPFGGQLGAKWLPKAMIFVSECIKK